MKKFALITIVLICSLRSLFPPIEKRPEFFAGFSFGTVNAGTSSTDLNLESCLKVDGLRLSMHHNFTNPFSVSIDFARHFDNRANSIDTTDDEFKFGLSERLQLWSPTISRLTNFARLMANMLQSNVTENYMDSSTSGIDCNMGFATNFGMGVDYNQRDESVRRPLHCNCHANWHCHTQYDF
jgi:hypothetical protein